MNTASDAYVLIDYLDRKKRIVYIMMALFFFGPFGVHNLYARRYWQAFCQLILSFTMVGLFVTIPWCLLEAISVKKDGDDRPFR